MDANGTMLDTELSLELLPSLTSTTPTTTPDINDALIAESEDQMLLNADFESLNSLLTGGHETTVDLKQGGKEELNEDGVDFDLEALFFESENSPDGENTGNDESNHDSYKIEESGQDDAVSRMLKRELTPPTEDDAPFSKIQKTEHTPAQLFHFPTSESDAARPVETLTPESSTVPSPASDCATTSTQPTTTTTTISTTASSIQATMQHLKTLMIPAPSLLHTYTLLKKQSSSYTSQLASASAQLSAANQGRFSLAAQNAELRAQVAGLTAEKDKFKRAISKLHSGTNGLLKNEKLRVEIEEKNLEIVRL